MPTAAPITGRAFVVFGSGARTVDTAALGVRFRDRASGGNARYAVAGLPDANADGLAEVVVGAYDVDPAGLVYIVYDRTATTPVVLSNLPRKRPSRCGGPAGDRFGRALAAGGNAFNDVASTTLIVGADAAVPAGSLPAGQVELFAVGAGGVAGTTALGTSRCRSSTRRTLNMDEVGTTASQQRGRTRRSDLR